MCGTCTEQIPKILLPNPKDWAILLNPAKGNPMKITYDMKLHAIHKGIIESTIWKKLIKEEEKALTLYVKAQENELGKEILKCIFEQNRLTSKLDLIFKKRCADTKDVILNNIAYSRYVHKNRSYYVSAEDNDKYLYHAFNHALISTDKYSNYAFSKLKLNIKGQNRDLILMTYGFERDFIIYDLDMSKSLKDCKATLDYLAQVEKVQEMHANLISVFETMLAMFTQYNTTEKLNKYWKEGLYLLPSIAQKTNLPLYSNDQLNQILDIPK